MSTHTGTATDPLALSDSDDLTLAEGGATGITTISTSFFHTRINWGNPITESENGPQLVPDPYAPAGPINLGISQTPLRDCRTTGMRIYKDPDATGVITIALHHSDGTLLASVVGVDTWVADDGGWLTYEWPAPVDLTEGQTYHFGYHYPTVDTQYAHSVYVWNGGLNYCVYPMVSYAYNGTSGGGWKKAGALSFPSVSGDRSPHNYYVDPIFEWDIDLPTYQKTGPDSLTDYYAQFPNAAPSADFPIGVYWADAHAHQDYADLGVNTVFAGSYEQSGYANSIIAAGLDWYPTLHDNDLSTVAAVQEDAALAARVKGYIITDEPEFNMPYNPPATLRTWRNNARRIDSTRPMLLNLSRITMENQGFVWLPSGVSAEDWTAGLREYMSLADIAMIDCYGIAHTQPFTYAGGANRYGIWIYPIQVHRMRNEICDQKQPFWGVVETTSAYPDSPTPEQVNRCVWSLLIAGADGIEYFDHRFNGAAVSADFNAMTNDPIMGANIQALNAQMQDLKGALLSPDAGLITGYTSTGELAANQGGYQQGAKIPMHYSSRVVGGTYYFFVQSIRDGETTATIEIPGFQDAVLEVLYESRTVTVDGDGFFTDDFTDGDYEYHLYSTTDAPVFTEPENVVAPVVSTDGTPETGETVTCSTGTWTGVPLPTYHYQWQRDTGGGFVDISGATTAAYVLQVADEDEQVRCEVTALNNQGAATANSNAITPSAPAPSPYAAMVVADGATAYWRLEDLTEEIAGHDLTNDGGGTTATLGSTGLIDDPTNGAVLFDNTGNASLSAVDHADLRLTGGDFSVELWVNPGFDAAFALVSKDGDFRVHMVGNHYNFSPEGAGGWSTDCPTTTTVAIGTPVHLVFTWELSTKIMRAYCNGVLENTVDASTFGYAPTTSGWGPLKIGKNTATIGGVPLTTALAPGTIDEVAIYQTLLDATQIEAHYDAGTP